MNKIEIKNKWTGSILFEYEKENNTLKDTVEKAVEEKANLREANLRRADLREADLVGADLAGADLLLTSRTRRIQNANIHKKWGNIF